MNTATIISLVVMLAMSVMFLIGKWSFGLTTMVCTVALVVTNVLTISEAFAGFTSQNNIMIACMFAICFALNKTDIPYYSAGLLKKIDQKNETKFVIGVMLVYILLNTLLGETAAFALIVPFLATIPAREGSRITPTKLIMPIVLLCPGFSFLIPVGLGATLDLMTDGFVSEIVPADQLLNFGDTLKVRILASIFVFVYIALMWKKYPDEGAGKEVAADNASGVKRSSLPMWKQIVVYLILAVTILGLVFSTKLGSYAYVIPMVAVLVLHILDIMNRNEVMNTLMGNVTWMLVGIAAVTAAINKTGAGEVIGQLLSPLLTWTNNGFILILIVCAFTTLMTTLFSNMACWSILTPLAATVAMQVGINPKSLIVAVAACWAYAFLLPSGSVTIAMAYQMGNYKAGKLLKYNIPLLIGLVFLTALSIYFLFPPF